MSDRSDLTDRCLSPGGTLQPMATANRTTGSTSWTRGYRSARRWVHFRILFSLFFSFLLVCIVAYVRWIASPASPASPAHPSSALRTRAHQRACMRDRFDKLFAKQIPQACLEISPENAVKDWTRLNTRFGQIRSRLIVKYIVLDWIKNLAIAEPKISYT